MLVLGLEDQPHVDLQHVIATDQRRAAAAGQYPTLKLRSSEAAAVKMKDASAAVGRIAETGHLNFDDDRDCCFDRNVNCALNNKSVLYVDRSALAYRYYRYGDRPRVGDFTYSGFLFSD